METIYIRIVVDTAATIAHKSLRTNSYLMDTTGKGSVWGRGKERASTTCVDGQIIKWSVCSIRPKALVSIKKFGGKLVKEKVMSPSKQGISGEFYWEGVVESQDETGNFPYICFIEVDGKTYPFKASLMVQTENE